MRAFIALSLPEDSKNSIGNTIEKLSANFPEVRWEDKNKAHITLAFFKFITGDEITFIRNTLRDISQENKAFNLSVGPLSYFYKRHGDSIVYLDVLDPEEKLKPIYTELKKKLDSKKLFLPKRVDLHTTIGKVGKTRYPHELKKLLANLAKNEVPDIGEFPVKSLDFYESLFGRDENTSRYQLIESFPLLKNSTTA